jgi:general L-amino acid transport system permease protein
MSLFGTTALTNRGIYVPEPLFSRSLGNIHLFGESSMRFDVSLDLVLILVVTALLTQPTLPPSFN